MKKEQVTGKTEGRLPGSCGSCKEPGAGREGD